MSAKSETAAHALSRVGHVNRARHSTCAGLQRDAHRTAELQPPIDAARDNDREPVRGVIDSACVSVASRAEPEHVGAREDVEAHPLAGDGLEPGTEAAEQRGRAQAAVFALAR